MNEHFTFSEALGEEPYHQMKFNVIFRILVSRGSYTFSEMQTAYSPPVADRAEI